MIGVALVIFFVMVVAFAIWIEEDNIVAFVITCICAIILLGTIASMPASPQIKEDSVTIQEIEYAVNKCEPFGGLKEFRSDVIICMDKTEIKMSFEPEKKVESE